MRTNIFLCCFVLALLALPASGATNDLTSTLQRGLFEEEANRNLDAAAQAYQAVSLQFDKDRALAATAIFRLGEIYRKQNKTNEAAAQYDRIVREFSDQETLTTLSRQNLVGLGGVVQTRATVVAGTATGDNLQSQYALLKAQLEQARKETNVLTIAKLLDDADLRETLQNERQFIRSPEALQKVLDAAATRALDYAEKRLSILQSVIAQARSTQSPTTAGQETSPTTDDEEKEIRRIQDMIKNSPDLINAPRLEEGTPLFQAATKGQLQVARFLLEHGAKVNAPAGIRTKTWGDWTPLIAAANGGHKAMVELLLDRGADVDARSQSGQSGDTALFRAAEKSFVGVAEALLAHKAGVNLGGHDADAPLHVAAGAGLSGMMELLLRNGANVNATNYQGETPLMQAAESGRLEAVKILLAAKADVNLQSTSGRTALSYAASGSLDVVKALLKAKADPNAGTLGLPLAMAAMNGRSEIAELLLRAGAKPDLASKTDQGFGAPGQPFFGGSRVNSPYGPYTALQIAVSKSDAAIVKLLFKFKAEAKAKVPWSNPPRSLVSDTLGNPEMLQAFLEAGADANADRADGWPLLYSACQESNARAVELLLAHGAKTEAKGPDGRTPLSYAAERNCLKCVELLLAAKADANATTTNGTTALYWAAYNGSKEMTEALIAGGAQVNHKNQGGETPLHWAVGYGGARTNAQIMADLLLAKGADPNVRNGVGSTPLDWAKAKSPPGVPAPAQPQRTALLSVLREHGALDDLPDFNSIRVTRQGLQQPYAVFSKGPKLTNQFTLLEMMMQFYNQSSVVLTPGQPYRPASEALPFPDFGRIIIRRPSQKPGGKEQEIKVSLLNNSNVVDCVKDVPVEFGDVIEIPERVHALNEASPNLVREVEQSFAEAKFRNDQALLLPGSRYPTNEITRVMKMADAAKTAILGWACLQKSVRLIVGGETASFTVDSWKEGFLTQALAKTEARAALRSSSDLSRVKVTRVDAKTGKPAVLIVDVSDNPKRNDDLWLRDGDVIEVPDKL